jgi:mono/diheme cytochrome c family protein
MPINYDSSFRIACAILCCLAPISAHAQNVAAGHAIAEKHCARCHAVAEGLKSKHALAPTFPVIANRYSVWGLQEALAEGIIVGHDEMPKYVFTPEQITNLLSFMDTFTREKSKAK